MAETTHTEWRRDQLSWTAESFHCLLFNSSALYYLQTPTRRYGHASTPPQFLPIPVDRDSSLWNGMCDRHRAEITVMQFTGHSLPVHHFLMAQWEFFYLVSYWQPSCILQFSCWPLHTDEQVLDVQLEHIISVRTQDIVWRTCRKRRTIERNGERENQENLFHSQIRLCVKWTYNVHIYTT